MKKSMIIIGAGIVGLAAALKIKEKHPDVNVRILEKENDIALHQTGNNSGVIHSGIYYKPGSLKALNCRKGYSMLLDFCTKHSINFEICGKLIIAVNQKQLPYLETVYERGIQNGLSGLRKIGTDEINEREPECRGISGILVPETGIVDYRKVAEKYRELIVNSGGEVITGTRVTGIRQEKNTIRVITDKQEYETDYLVSCAGLHSDRIAKMTNPELPLRIIPFRGEYYKLRPEKENLVKSLIYPVPDPAFPFLGVHFTRMAKGGVEAGPNAVLAFKREGYSKTDFNLLDTLETFAWPGFRSVMYKYWQTGLGEFYRSFNKKAFTKALQGLVPGISEDDLTEGGAGIRAQACGRDGGLIDDFYFAESRNILHVCNAPSPAATSSLAIGEYIADRITEQADIKN